MRKVGKVRFVTLVLTGGLLGSGVCGAQGADLPAESAPAPTSRAVLLRQRCKLFSDEPR